VADLSCRHPLAIVLGGALLTVLSIFGIVRLHFETGLADYLPEDSPVVSLFSRAVEHYGTSAHLVIMLQGTPEDVEVRQALADDLAERLQACGLVLSVDHRFESERPGDHAPPILDFALFYLDEDGLEEMARLLETDAIQERVRANKEILRSPASLVAKDLVARDPLGLRDLIGEKFRELKGNLNIRLRDGYPFSQDLEILVMLVKPVKPAQDLAFTDTFLSTVHGLVEESWQTVAESYDEEEMAGVEIGLTGGYPIVSEYNALLKQDLGWTIGTAFVGVMGLFLISFRRIGSLLYVGVPLIVGVAWTMGFAGFVIGHLNLFTAAAAAVLLGLAIDFAIHLFNRYVGERDAGRTMDEAIHCAVVETGDGVVTAALTTVAAFAACTITPIDGLVQLGVICSVGMLLGLMSTFLLMPALLKLRGGRRHRESYKDSSFNFGLGAVARQVTTHAWPIIGGWVVLTGIFVWASLEARIDTDMRSLRPGSSEAIALQRKLTDKIGSGLVYSMILVEADSEEEALRRNAKVARRLDRLVERNEVVFYLSLSNLLPPPESQAVVLRWLAERRRRDPGSLDPDRIAGDLARFMDEEGFRLGPEYEQTVALVRRALSLDQTFTLDELDDLVAPKHISRFVHQENDHTEMVTYVYPNQSGHAGQYRVMELLEANVVGDIENAHVIGVAILGRELKRLIKEGSLEAAVLALLLVLVLLWSHFRDFRYVILTAVPLVLGELGAIGGMTLLGLNLNMVNMGIIPIILGIGIDDGIHITHRFIDQGERNVVSVFRFAGRAVVITSLTTMVGFGSLAFASYKGLWTAGVFAILGVGMCLLSSVTLLPALLQVFVVRRRERRAGAEVS
jgi:predicted RND superfamily exporter protein